MSHPHIKTRNEIRAEQGMSRGRHRRLFAGVGLAAVLASGAALAAVISSSNYSTPGGAKWEIGGVLETLPGGVFRLDTSATKTATAVAGAATLNTSSGIVTSEPLSTAASSVYTLTIANSRVSAGDEVFASVSNGTNTGGGPHVGTVTPGNGTLTITVRNAAGATALNGTIAVAFMVVKN